MASLEIIWKILAIIGSVGLFLYGMKFMSESLQRAAGNNMRTILSVISSNPARGIFSGFLLTNLIQFSSATVVLTISLVNAGLISLYQSVGIIIGANIGTTVKAWFISMLGFRYDFSMLLLPLVAVALPLLFAGRNNYRYWGEFLLGFALIFIGFNFMKESLPVMDADSPVLLYLSRFTGMGFLSVLVFVLIGLVITVILQSSSAGMALVFVMVSNHWVSFELAAAMVLGENLGTTFVPLVASIVSNQDARRAAMIHVLFNLCGIILALLLFHSFTGLAAWFTEIFTGKSPADHVAVIPFALAFVHTAFNVGTAVVLAGLIPQLVKISGFLVPVFGKKASPGSSTYLDDKIVSTQELQLLQAGKEVTAFGTALISMFEKVPVLFNQKDREIFEQMLENVLSDELKINEIEASLRRSLTRLSQGEMSVAGSRQISALLKIIDDMESIGDVCTKMAKVIRRKNSDQAWFSPEIRQIMYEMFDLDRRALHIMIQNLGRGYKHFDIGEARAVEETLNSRRDLFRADFESKLKRQEYPVKTGVYFNELLALSEKLGDYCINVSEALARLKS